MEKVEKNLVIANQGGKRTKNLIKASTILDITLEDYHQSRKLYGQDKSNLNLEKFNNERSNYGNKEELYEEFYDETVGGIIYSLIIFIYI
jgi:hypothetical protein